MGRRQLLRLSKQQVWESNSLALFAESFAAFAVQAFKTFTAEFAKDSAKVAKGSWAGTSSRTCTQPSENGKL
jgi:NADPH-dependent 7-cyano-7-deazaguanine reductase QueF-like protein